MSEQPEVRRALPLWLVVVLGLAGTFVAVRGLHTYRALITPVLLAFVLVVVAHPLIGILVRRGLRRAFAVAVAVALVDGGLIVFGVLLAVSIGQLATVLPQYEDQWQSLLDVIRRTLSSWGIGQDEIEQALHRSEEHTSELQSRQYLVCRLLL